MNTKTEKWECKTIADHKPVWCGDSYECFYCRLRFIPTPMTNPHEQPQHQKEPCFHTPVQQIGFSKYCSKCGERIDKESHPQPSKEGDVRIEDILRDATFPTPVLKRVAIDSVQSLLKEERQKAEKVGAVKALESIIFMYSDDARREDLASLLDDIQEGIAFKIQHPEVVLTHDTTQEPKL